MSEREKVLAKWANRLAAAAAPRPVAVVTVQRLCYLCFIILQATLELSSGGCRLSNAVSVISSLSLDVLG
jgi:hypothetical protein